MQCEKKMLFPIPAGATARKRWEIRPSAGSCTWWVRCHLRHPRYCWRAMGGRLRETSYGTGSTGRDICARSVFVLGNFGRARPNGGGRRPGDGKWECVESRSKEPTNQTINF